MGCSPWGRKESDTTERLHFRFSLSCIGEGNGNPLQCSCLENPRDGGTWWAAVYGVTQSQIQLKRLSSSSSSRYSCISLYFSFEVLLIYNVVLISAVQKNDLGIHIYIYILLKKYSVPLWFITEYWIQFPVMDSRNMLSVCSYITVCICSSQTPTPFLPSQRPCLYFTVFLTWISLILMSMGNSASVYSLLVFSLYCSTYFDISPFFFYYSICLICF